MKKAPLSIDKLKKTIKSLSSIGILNYKASDIKNLSPQQKGAITKKYREYAHYINKPQDFSVKKVSANNKKLLKEAGYKTSNTNRALIPLKGNENVKLKKGELYFTKGERIERVYLSKNSDDLIRKIKSLEKKKGILIGIKIGENTVANARFLNIKDASNYVQNILIPKKRIESEQEFRPLISMVEINEKPQQKIKQARTKKDRRN